MADLQTIWKALAEVTDPEMPVSIVDMGLIYDIRLDCGGVEVDMTFTAIACPGMDMLLADVREKVSALPGIASVKINVVWNPPWNKGRLTDQGRDILQSFGVAV